MTGYKIDPWVAPEIRIFQVLEKYYNISRSQRYIALARELGKLRSRGEKIRSPRTVHEARDDSWKTAEEEAKEESAGASTDPIPATAATQAPPAPEVSKPKHTADPWEKYGYGKSWREFAEAMEHNATTPPQAPATEIPAPPQPRRPRGPGASAEIELAEASRRLAACSSPEEVAEAVLAFAGRFLRRTAFFVLRGDQAVALGGTGEGFGTGRLRGMRLPLVRDSLFTLIEDGRQYFVGAAPAFPSIRKFYLDLAVPEPKAAFLMPIRIKEKPALILYGDGGTEDDLRSLDLDAFERLAAKASLALQMIIFRGKILSS